MATIFGCHIVKVCESWQQLPAMCSNRQHSWLMASQFLLPLKGSPPPPEAVCSTLGQLLEWESFTSYLAKINFLIVPTH